MKKIILILSLIFTIGVAADKPCVGKCGVEISKNEKDIELKEISYSKLDGKYIVYSKKDCGVCNAAYKQIQKIKDKFGEYTNIAVVVLPNYSKNEIKDYFNKKGYTFEVFYDTDKKLINVLNITEVPSIFKYESKSNTFTGFPHEYLNLDTYYEEEKNNIDKYVKDEIANVNVMDKYGNIKNINEILSKDALVIYGAPWCSDCVNEYERLNNIKKARKLIYLIEDGRYTKEQYFDYAKNKDDVYYVIDQKIRKIFNLKWIPSVTEIKHGLFTAPFVRNDVYKFE